MSNGQLPTQTLELEIPTYLPLGEAAQKYDLSEQVLTQLIQAGKIEAVRLPSGELLVSAENGQHKTKEDIINDKFAHLRGQVITVTEAAEKYGEKCGFHRNTILEWVKHEYITVHKPGYRMELDEADVAYCADVYRQRKKAGGTRGVPLLDEKGLPYELKSPEMAQYRRHQRRRGKKR
jgi:hypothetical protein